MGELASSRGGPAGGAAARNGSEVVRYRARWLLPITAPPIRDGWVDVAAGRIVAVGSAAGRGGEESSPCAPGPASAVVDLGGVALLPGLVNAHTHLELADLGGRVPPASALSTWVRDLLAARAASPGHPDPTAIGAAIAEAHATGTVLFGDVTNTLATVEPLAASGLFARVFYELLGFGVADPQRVVCEALERLARRPWTPRVRPALAAHAPYSVAPGLFGALRSAVDRLGERPYSVHLAESREELELLAWGTGPWRTLLEERGAWPADWSPPGQGPVGYLERLGWFGPGAVIVHGVHLTDAELARLAAYAVVIVTCPRSNAWTGAGAAPVARFYRAGVRVAVGTDSPASVPDLNLFADLAAIRRLAPEVPARRILESATLRGAEALGFEPLLGSLTPGKLATLLAVRVPADVEDVEEYLVGGIGPEAVRWVREP